MLMFKLFWISNQKKNFVKNLDVELKSDLDFECEKNNCKNFLMSLENGFSFWAGFLDIRTETLWSADPRSGTQCLFYIRAINAFTHPRFHDQQWQAWLFVQAGSAQRALRKEYYDRNRGWTRFSGIGVYRYFNRWYTYSSFNRRNHLCANSPICWFHASRLIFASTKNSDFPK